MLRKFDFRIAAPGGIDNKPYGVRHGFGPRYH